jgi:hypothetical protein
MSFTKSAALAVAATEESDGAMQTYNRLLAKYVTAFGSQIFGMEEQRHRCASAPERGGRDCERKNIQL